MDKPTFAEERLGEQIVLLVEALEDVYKHLGTDTDVKHIKKRIEEALEPYRGLRDGL